MNKILIAIVSYNAKRYMQECIYSIRRCLPADSYGIFVVDNASNDGIAEWLSEQPDITLIRNDHNVGFGPGCNQAVKASVGTEFETSDVFLLNNDTVLCSNSLPNMLSAFEKYDKVGAVSAVSNYAGNRQQLELDFPSTEDYIQFGENLSLPENDRYMEKVRLNGFAMVIKRHLWDEIGGFDEDFAPGYYEDDALSMEILKRGYRLVLARNSYIYHAGSISFVKTGKNTLSFDHHELFIKKYGFDILDYVYPSGSLISQIPFGRDESFTLLQIGSGLGAELKAVRSIFPKATVYGVETNTALYDISRKTENVFTSVEDAAKKLNPNSLDLIMVSDDLIINHNDTAQFAESITNDTTNNSNEDSSCNPNFDLFSSKLGMLQNCCKSGAKLIIHHPEYETLDYDSLRLVLWSPEVYVPSTASLLASHGIINFISDENAKELIAATKIPNNQILCISSRAIVSKICQHSSEQQEKNQTASQADEHAEKRTNRHIDEHTNNSDINTSFAAYPADIIPYITAHFGRLKATDPSCRMQRRFENLRARTNTINIENLDSANYLKKANTTITFNKNCLERCGDILELLRFSDIPMDKAKLDRLVSNDWNDSAYITAKDSLYDYGIVGFYCFDNRSQKFLCLHISFEAEHLDPENLIKRKLSLAHSDDSVTLGFITEDSSAAITTDPIIQNRLRVLLKGPSSLSPIADYLIGGNITTEFFDGESDSLPTKLFANQYHVIIYSLLQFSYGKWKKDGDSELGKLFEELENICAIAPGNPTLILLLGSEKEYADAPEKEKDLASLYSELNPILSDFADDHENVYVINVTDLIHDQSDFDGSINRFSTKVYSDITEEICKLINQVT